MLRQSVLRGLGMAALVGFCGGACQEYPFEPREPELVRALQINEVVTTIKPTDILFVIDNSGSMIDEVYELESSFNLFVQALSESANEYRLGFVTPDLECNVPGRQCTDGGTSSACCGVTGLTDTCEDRDDDIDGTWEYSTCDGGRLRTASGGSPRWNDGRYYHRPPAAELEEWLDEVRRLMGEELGCKGSGYEATLEAARRAIVCSLSTSQREAAGLRIFEHGGGCATGPDCPAGFACEGNECQKSCALPGDCGAGFDCRAGQCVKTCLAEADCARDYACEIDTCVRDGCPNPRVADLNAGFIREEAALVIVLVSDEDDCSFRDFDQPNTRFENVFRRLDGNSANDASEQQDKLCSPKECYAYLGTHLDTDTDGLMNWSDRGSPLDRAEEDRLDCSLASPTARSSNPPLPDPVATFLDDIIAAKGGDVSLVRAGAILGALSTDEPVPLGFESSACLGTVSAPSDQCLCWSTTPSAIYCEVTSESARGHDRIPTGGRLAKCDTRCTTHTDCGVDEICGPSGVCEEEAPGGCQAMGSGRILEFLQDLSARRVSAGEASATVVDSICEFQYDDTLLDIVRISTLENCFDIGLTFDDPQDVRIVLKKDGREIELKHRPPGSIQSGWSWETPPPPATSVICLEGEGLTKEIGDKFEIFLLVDN